MSNNEQANELLVGLGALAESSGYLRDQFIKSGFTRKEAVDLVAEYIRSTFTAARGDKND